MENQMDQNSNDNICRICLNIQDTLFSLFRKHHGASPYEKLISRTKLNIQLNDSGPPSICSQCLIDLDTTVSFLDKCERSNQLLRVNTTRSFNERSEFEADSLEIESETQPVFLEPHEEDGREVVNSSGEDAKCPKCGSKRRCKHWAPPKEHTCQYCKKTFNKKYNYQVHVKRHLGGARFSCSKCGEQQPTRWAAETHCSTRPRQPCPTPGCGKSFTSSTNLNTHIRKHSGERPFECDNCGRTFISKNILYNHMRTHTGVKPYMCQVCGKQFATNKLAAHMAQHGAGAGEGEGARVHRCPCSACLRGFRSARALRSHARTHSQRRPHACALCGTRYKFKQSLNYHIKTAHSDDAKTTVQPESSPMPSMISLDNCDTTEDCQL